MHARVSAWAIDQRKSDMMVFQVEGRCLSHGAGPKSPALVVFMAVEGRLGDDPTIRRPWGGTASSWNVVAQPVFSAALAATNR
jgi:hypothetical protein